MPQRGLFRASGLAVLAGLALGVSSAPRAQAADEPCIHLKAAMYELREAKGDVRALTGLTDDQRSKTLGAIDSAIQAMKQCARDLDLGPVDPLPIYPPGDDKPIREIIREMKAAKEELKAAKNVTDEHRDAAIAAMDKSAESLRALDPAK